ncbi:MAG: 50S ribosomal protein L10 [Candidatus Woesearchaeota archaeon]
MKVKKNKNEQKKISEKKLKEVDEILKLIDEYSIIGLVNMENLPAKQLQRMRAQLQGKVILRMTKKNIIKIALKKSDNKNLLILEKYLTGMPALLFCREDPFKLYKILKKNKSKAPIKPGQIAPQDIVVPKGPTSFAPGPVIGELGAFKIKTGIENGKVVIKEDSLVAKSGNPVPEKLAGLLTRLGIEPIEIGLNLLAIYNDGQILTKDVLDIDESAYIEKIKNASAESLILAISISFTTKETILLLLTKAFVEAKHLAIERSIISKDSINELLAIANAQAEAINKK